MLLTALPPAPPTPNTVIRGLSSLMSGIFRLMLIFASSLRGRRERRRCTPVRGRHGWNWDVDRFSSEALAKPSTDPSDVAARPCQDLPRMPRFVMFEMRNLCINQKAGRHGERRALGRFR